MYIKRTIEAELAHLSASYPIITITGPRQSGKTTLIKHVFADKPYFNLEDPDLRQLVTSDPRGFLQQLPQGAILDEVQNVPQLPSYLQAIVDDKQQNSMFILSGSQQFELLDTITQSLAGRSALLSLLPLSLNELQQLNKQYSTDQLLINGLYPRIYNNKQDPSKAYKNYYKNYI
jgi:predicted AAA+ superfamily ATPase